jgi:KAP-like P-loop domain-containing protein
VEVVGPTDGFGHDPIERSEDDRLDRTDFANLLAMALATSPERRSMVVALYGDWGSGKTSSLNLCFEALRQLTPEQQPLVVRFNPWSYSNTGELLNQFFEVLGNALEEQAESRRVQPLRGIKGKLLSYRQLIAPAGAVADLLVGGGALTLGTKFIQAAVERAAQEQEGKRDAREARRKVEDALLSAKRRIVIAIDDIDRLSASEIRDVFKVVKATADFANTRYLLAFDFNTVAVALKDVQKTDGAAYLEKIVQVPFRLPDPAPGQLMAIVSEGMDKIMSQQEKISTAEREQARASLESLASYGLSSLWDNMRRVNRFLDSLRLTLPTVAGEVNVSDFALLEALRVTEPRVYESVLDGRKLLLGPGPGAEMILTRGPGDPQGEINRATAALMDTACDATPRKDLRDVIRRILEKLFPRVRSATGRVGSYGRDHVDQWANEKRVCVEEYFDIATRWSLVPGAISDAEVRELVEITDSAVLRERLHVYDHDARDGVNFVTMVRKIGPFYRTEADAPALEAIVQVMLGEETSDDSYIPLRLLARDALRRLPNSSERKRVLLDAIGTYRVLPVMLALLRDLGKEQGWSGNEALPDEYRQLTSTDFRTVTSAAVADIINLASESTLLRRNFVAGYLYFWRDATDGNETGKYLQRTLAARDSFIELLSNVIGEEDAQRLRNGETLSDPPIVRSRLHILWDFEVAHEARARADKLLAEDLSDTERNLIEWFIDAHQQMNTSTTDP